MSTPRPSAGLPGPAGTSARARRLQLIIIGLVAVAVLIGAFTVWYFFFRPAGPAALGPGAPAIPAGAVATAPATLAP